MNQKVKQILYTINRNGYEAYIVGGYPRDSYINKKTEDYDITTNATPEQLKNIFPHADYQSSKYGRITIQQEELLIEITTYRIESDYEEYRFPRSIIYAKELKQDLLRRDFIINTLCMDEKGNYIDLLGARKDIDNKIIRTVGDPFIKMKEDALRILRAIRFSAMLDFEMDSNLKKAIQQYKNNVKKLSYFRKKEELNRLFTSDHVQRGIELLRQFGIDRELEIKGLEQLNINTSLLGIWAQLEFSSKYEFTHNERKGITKIRKLLQLDILNPFILYTYGHYYCGIVAEIKGLSKSFILEQYQNLAIHHRNEIAISAKELMQWIDKEMINMVYEDLEQQILTGKLDNIKTLIKRYIIEKYDGRKT